MKFRRLFVTSLAGLTLLLANCGGSALDDPLTQEYETIVGEFKSLAGIKVDKTITHLFENDEGEIYYAFSDRYDLDDQLNERVEVAGLVMEYETLDKPTFKVTRISEAPEEEEESAEVTYVDYADTELGFSLSYPDNWSFESFRDSIELTAPLEKAETDEEEEASSDAEVSTIPRDVILVAMLDVQLRSTTEDDSNARATDIHTQISQAYPDLADESGQVTMIGDDQQFAVRYKIDNGSTHYFIPRGTSLIELSLYHSSEESVVSNSNIFAEVVNSFRLLPTGDDGEFINDEPTTTDAEPEEEPEETEEMDENTTSSSGDQVTASKYREFESNPYQFKISYPSHWYYSGGNQGYDFSTDPIEDDAPAIIRLDINGSTSTGLVRTGSSVKITVEVEGKYYTLTGPSEYESIMQKMVDSIEPVEGEES